MAGHDPIPQHVHGKILLLDRINNRNKFHH
jgi:hypothetical protein